MLLSAEAPERKLSVGGGGLMPVRWWDVGQRRPESLATGVMTYTQQKEPREILPSAPWIIPL